VRWVGVQPSVDHIVVSGLDVPAGERAKFIANLWTMDDNSVYDHMQLQFALHVNANEYTDKANGT
jgi:hypothetical protein